MILSNNKVILFIFCIYCPSHSVDAFAGSIPLWKSVSHPMRSDRTNPRPSSLAEALNKVDGIDSFEEYEKQVVPMNTEKESADTSKRKMLAFALPALGIFLSSPLLSNIDNAFIGKTAGSAGLAALSPATICTDQMLYLFSFLSRATTGIVSRAYTDSSTTGDVGLTKNQQKNEILSRTENAKNAASTPITVAFLSGIMLSLFYFKYTPNMLKLLNVDPALQSQSANYVYWRGSVAWAALVQNVSLSVMLATRDAISPLKIISLAAVVNVIGDTLLCVYPLRWGCAGAAAATAFATLFSSFFMLKGLAKKSLMPKLSIPQADQVKELFDYVGPLFVITITRLIGFISMQRAAMRCGLEHLAAYQICINCLIFFILFGEPLSQLHQTKLPVLIDEENKASTISTMKSVLSLASYTALGISAVAFITLTFCTGFFTSDQAVQKLISGTAPSVSAAIVSAIMAIAIDGAMLASRDFSFILIIGVLTCVMQLLLSSRCSTLSAVFLSFALRLLTYSVSAIGRVALGYGSLGRVLK